VETRYGDVANFTTKAVATATVTTSEATNITSASAKLNGSFSGATGEIYDRGFKYKRTIDNTWSTVGLNSTTGTSGSFSATISSLHPNTEYMFLAYVTEWNENSGQYEDRWDTGNALTFTTSGSSAPVTTTGWLELPALTGSENFVGKFYGSGSTAGTNRNYSYNYSYTYYASMWVAYPLTAAHTTGNGGDGNWDYNPNIPTNRQVSITSKSYPTIYGASAYSRGHQCPNASRLSNEQMNDQTYYATNQTPQLQNKFNASVWSALEGAVRNLTSSADTVYVVTGPAYRKVNGSETINYLTGASGQNANPSSLPIPNYYWKALLKVERNSAGAIIGANSIAFWFDHREYASTERYYDSEHIISVNKLEEWTGFDLFHNLPDDLEETVESNTSWSGFQSSSNINSVKGNNWGSF
jgi:endonuclease G